MISASMGSARGSSSVVASPSGTITAISTSACVSIAPCMRSAASSSPSVSNIAVSSAIIVTPKSAPRLTARRRSRKMASFFLFSLSARFCARPDAAPLCFAGRTAGLWGGASVFLAEEAAFTPVFAAFAVGFWAALPPAFSSSLTRIFLGSMSFPGVRISSSAALLRAV